MWIDTVVQQLQDRDEIEKKNIDLYSAFYQLNHTLTAKQLFRSNNDLEIKEPFKSAPLADNDNLIHRFNSLQIQFELLETKVQQMQRVNKTIEKEKSNMKLKINSLNLEIAEKNKAIETINDELLSCNIQNNVLSDTIQKLSNENETLVTRWMEKVKNDAERLNDANEALQ